MDPLEIAGNAGSPPGKPPPENPQTRATVAPDLPPREGRERTSRASGELASLAARLWAADLTSAGSPPDVTLRPVPADPARGYEPPGVDGARARRASAL